VYGFDFSTEISTSPLRAVAILTLDDFHKVSRAVGPQKTGVEHTEEADLGAKMLGIASDFEKGFGAGLQQQMVQDFLVLQGERCQFMG